MELKNYQKKVMDNLSAYMGCLDESAGLDSAWHNYWSAQDIAIGSGGVPAYNNEINGVPHICMKVPTGGGKTFMACASIRKIFDAMPSDRPRVVVWLVPSDQILVQTVKTLSDVNHPYRQRLDMDFAGRVGVYTKEMLLNGQNFSPDTVREMLTICILSYGSLRIDSKKKDVRKIYQENGNLFRFATCFGDDDVLLANTPDTALIQALRRLTPVTVVDESHNAGSSLSVEMLNNLNPSFVLDLTATPKKNSNIISYVDARELKKENMVKLPVVVYNRTSRQSVIQDAILLRGSIERQAIAEEQAQGQYIRPIVLFQAQPKVSEESETFDKIRSLLIDMGIPKEEIAVKTSKVDDLGNIDLMSRDCPVRYIITVNALKEGWDCPFAYILASLANRTSPVDVEQILGRILRQPYARQHSAPLLNASYVLTCSRDFHSTLENIVKGLNRAGFSRKDYRIGESVKQETVSAKETERAQDGFSLQQTDAFEDISPAEIRTAVTVPASSWASDIACMEQEATQAAKDYATAIASTDEIGIQGSELGEMLNRVKIQSQFREEVMHLRIPQFFLKSAPDLFCDDSYDLLEPDNLSEGFVLSGQDAQISFELTIDEIYRVDIQEQGEAVPKYKRASRDEREYVRKFLATLPPEQKVRNCIDMICKQINRSDRYTKRDIEDYVRRIVARMTDDELKTMETAVPAYTQKIRQKIDTLENAWRRQQFYRWLDSGKIVCRESFVLPQIITPASVTDAISCSLYEAERNDMNEFERRVIDVVAGLDNIRWWHRIIDRKGLRLNAFINHYPDFMVMTKSGKLALIEVKGDYLDGDDSRTKLKLGRTWQSLAGQMYRYFMVFGGKDLGMSGAYTLDGFVDVMREL
ncbi:DEAD/DEAH box helicase family protein [Oxalobacter aliiformigenes]|uniref:DEAD/DEAH box helicase n=1 Tax=Oxalobacter aliiformigenes TaxID=2946593 RepID=UPI0022AFB435|nr:DEAD/DEAH box helicase family protein [Oxalobacter aliiformigenes]MCZ4064497.1 DEAD/DEAH box helicase family protein [Oxalobacter aliiformigenes]WAV99836.1 DEAD/DEAH box helicase family protein [Oxalobacter aliiformigenes]